MLYQLNILFMNRKFTKVRPMPCLFCLTKAVVYTAFKFTNPCK